MRLHLLLSCSVLLCFSLRTQGLDYDPVKDFCRRFSHQAAVVGNKLYIDGGQVTINGRHGENLTNKNLLYHDLNSPGIPLMINLTKGPEVPSVIGGYLWADDVNGKIYLYGGEFVEGEPDTSPLWCYDTYNDSWLEHEVSKDISRISFGAGTVDKYSGKGYYLGGWLGDRNVLNWQGGRRASSKLITYDMIGNDWRNDSGPHGDALAEGVLEYIPAGDGGMLIYFGGVRVPGGAESAQVAAPMNQVEIYDVSAGTWYTQNATGTIPEPRRRFCSDVAIAQDKSSYNIYLFGGLGFPPTSNAFSDVYILSIPSFTWLKIDPPGPIYKQPKFPRFDSTCNVINNAQMLIIGGNLPNNMKNTNCDVPKGAGVHCLSMGKQNDNKEYWHGLNPVLRTYEVPDNLIKVIGGGPTGAATRVSPSSGFNSPELKTLFGRVAKFQPREATPTFRILPIATKDKKKPGTSKAVIIGPVVGGIAVLVGATLLYICILRKRKAAAVAANPGPVSGSAFTTNYMTPPSSPPRPIFNGLYPQQHQQFQPGNYQDANYQQQNQPLYTTLAELPAKTPPPELPAKTPPPPRRPYLPPPASPPPVPASANA